MSAFCIKCKKREKIISSTKHKDHKDELLHESKNKRDDNEIIKIVKVTLIFFLNKSRINF